MKLFTDEEIESFYTDTIGGFYLKECANNSGGDAKEFYENQLKEFNAGFKCCMEKVNTK